jgi:membrane dipeptidase
LTDRGRAFVRRAQELGILIDVSHLSEKAFWDLVDITSAPIVASHSNSRAVCDHSRNLTDKQFKVICNLGGLVGLNLYGPFLNPSGKADFSDVKRHLDHFLALGGQHHLALGGDLDGCDSLPTGFTGIDNYNDLGRWLMQQGMEELTVNNIFNNNAVRFAMQHLQRKRVGG